MELLETEKKINKRNILTVGISFLFTIVTLYLGYVSFGFMTMMIFSSGFLGGFILWILIPSDAHYSKLQMPYLTCLLLFFIHRVEEKLFGFFNFLSSITNVSTPEIFSWNVIALVILSVGGWLCIPLLLKRSNEFGYYLAWTFFASMGITELAHWLVFPFLVEKPFTYIPGMMSVILLAPAAWLGFSRLYQNRT